MSIQNKQLDQQSFDRASHMAFVYAKDGKIRVLHIEQANRERDGLVADGWKHTATFDAAMFIENLWNVEAQNNAAIYELRKLTLTYKERCAEKEASEAIELIPENGSIEIIHPKDGPAKIYMTIKGPRSYRKLLDPLIGLVLKYKIQGKIQMPFTGSLSYFLVEDPIKEELINEINNPGYEALMDYKLKFTLHE